MHRHDSTRNSELRTGAHIAAARSQPLPRNFPLAVAAVVAATVGYAAWLHWQIGGESSVLYFSDAGTVSASLIATVACFRAGLRHTDRLRTSWWLLGAACATWMLGEMIWTGYDLAGTGGPPNPSWADLGYLSFIPLAIAALLAHPGLHGTGARKVRSLIDGLAIGLALLFVSWTFVLAPIARSSGLTTFGDVVTLAYPVGDVVIAFFVLLAIQRMRAADRLTLWCLFAGLSALALADSTYAYVEAVKHYESGNMLDTGWLAGFLGIALGAFASNEPDVPVQAEPSPFSLPSLIAPLLPMFVALSLAGISIDSEHRPDGAAVAMLLALIALALARQALLVLDFVRAGRGEEFGHLLDRFARAALSRPFVESPGGAPPRSRRPEGP
jgi:diguanylate cyclase